MDVTKKRTLLYVGITFALTWGWWFATAYPLALSGSQMATSPLLTLAIGAGMLFPALGALITRLVTREGFRGTSMIKPAPLRRTWKYFVLGWLGPAACIVAGAAVYFLLFPGDFDPAMSALVESQMNALEQAGQGGLMTADGIRALMAVQMASAVLIAPLLNAPLCFGEEWGWRGYLLPKLAERHSMGFALVASGVIWGLWHAPITVLGHNYGLGYAGWPVTGILAMCCFCTAVGTLLGYVTLRSGSCLPAVLGHGMLNGFAATGVYLTFSGGNPFVGPMPTGIVGGAAFIAAAALCAWSLVKRARAGLPQVDAPAQTSETNAE